MDMMVIVEVVEVTTGVATRVGLRMIRTESGTVKT
jgi:hypothetical protein